MKTAPDTQSTDIVVVGGGACGFITSTLLAQAGFYVHIFVPPPPPDTRTTALLRGSISLLRSAGVWSHLEPQASPLKIMRLIDDSGRLPRAPSISFNSSEFGSEPFGFNIANSFLLKNLDAEIVHTQYLTIHREKLESLTLSEDHVIASGFSGASVKARLVIGADGFNSTCRDVAGIGGSKHFYDQVGLSFNLDHDLPHQNASTEFYTVLGSFTLVPLVENRQSNLVWIVPPSEAERIRSLPSASLKQEIKERSHGILGNITKIGPLGSFPVVCFIADEMAKKRIALVGDSGHVLPPIGAQGLNLGFRDIATLVEILKDSARRKEDIGSATTLSLYDQRRRLDINTRANAIHLLNSSITSKIPFFQIGRAAFLLAAKQSGLIQDFLVDLALYPVDRGTSAYT